MVLKIKERIKNQKGFTLVELMATLGILALIVAIAVPAVGAIMDKANKQADVSSINMIETAGTMAYMGDVEFSNKSKESYTVPKLVESGYLDISKDSEFYDSLNYVAKSGSSSKFKYHQINVSVATDDDFIGDGNGPYKYIGTDKIVRIPHVIDGNKITNYNGMFEGNADVETVISDNPHVSTMSSMFEYTEMSDLDLSHLDTSGVKNMSYMFEGSKVNTLDLSGFDTSNVTDMERMFINSESKYIDLSGFVTENVTDMTRMFDNAHVETLDLSSFETPLVKGMGFMFQNTKIKELDISGFDFTRVDLDEMKYILSSPSITNVYVKSTEDIEKLKMTDGTPSGLTFTVK